MSISPERFVGLCGYYWYSVVSSMLPYEAQLWLKRRCETMQKSSGAYLFTSPHSDAPGPKGLWRRICWRLSILDFPNCLSPISLWAQKLAPHIMWHHKSFKVGKRGGTNKDIVEGSKADPWFWGESCLTWSTCSQANTIVPAIFGAAGWSCTQCYVPGCFEFGRGSEKAVQNGYDWNQKLKGRLCMLMIDSTICIW